MKKVININFQGRIIPIEESAHELLMQYIESLRSYFSNEEGRDEIVNDIEGRIAELFSERIKNGIPCITDEEVNTIIRGMGRPADFDEQDNDTPTAAAMPSNAGQSFNPGTGRSTLCRNEDDKILAGVCSGLASYLKIDPVVLRILFVLLSGVLFWVYILLWIIVPSKSIQSNITRRLYRNPDQKVIAGVCGGIAAYFNIEVWIPRLIFVLPFILALISGSFNSFSMHMDIGFIPRIISGSFGWSLLLTYVVLWISVPFANTSSEKLEMRGAKVDLNSIANTVRSDLQSFRGKAQKWGVEVQSTATRFGQEAASQMRGAEGSETKPAKRGGLGYVIRILFKAFFIVVFAIIAITLFGIFVALLIGGMALAPLIGFILEGPLQNVFAWMMLILFFALPVIAFITWGIRRLVGVRSKKNYVGVAFSVLWVIGLFSGVALVALVAGNFKNTSSLKEEPLMVSNSKKLTVEVEGSDWKSSRHQFFGMEMGGEDLPFYDINEDSIFINTVKISMVKSNDSAFHIYRIRAGRGSSKEKASVAAENIRFDIEQKDSLVVLPRGFNISKKDKFRNQRVWIVVEIPLGQTISFSEKISTYNWFNVRSSRSGIELDDDNWDNRDNMYRPSPGMEYIMTREGKPERITP